MTTPDTLALLEPIVATPEASAILLDLDGTVAPIVDRPADVRVLPEIRRILPVLRERYALLAFLSGRALEELRRIVGLDGVGYSGNHGREVQLSDGRLLPAGIDAAGDAVAAFVDACDREDLARVGVWVENKGATATFHYRTAPDRDAARRLLDEIVVPAATKAGLVAHPGRMSIEIHPSSDVHKGTATLALLEANPGIRRVIAFGDDRTDVDVWSALRARVATGGLDQAVAVGVIADESPDAVRTGSDVQVAGVTGTFGVLRVLAGHLGR